MSNDEWQLKLSAFMAYARERAESRKQAKREVQPCNLSKLSDVSPSEDKAYEVPKNEVSSSHHYFSLINICLYSNGSA